MEIPSDYDGVMFVPFDKEGGWRLLLGRELRSAGLDIELLIEYAKRLGNGAVFKRLGFLLERYASEQKSAIDECKSQLTAGNVKLDPTIKSDKLITRWRLWVPRNWAKES